MSFISDFARAFGAGIQAFSESFVQNNGYTKQVEAVAASKEHEQIQPSAKQKIVNKSKAKKRKQIQSSTKQDVVNKSRANFIEKAKRNPNLFFKLVNKAKTKVKNALINIKQKLIDIKKSISKLTVSINKLKAGMKILRAEARKLQNELKNVRNQISQLEKQPGNEKEIEALKEREKEILDQLRELSERLKVELSKVEEMEYEKEELEKEKTRLEKSVKNCNTRLTDLDKQELEFKRDMGFESRQVQPLQMVEDLRKRIKENALLRRQEQDAKQVSYGNMAFRAILGADYNMNQLQSAKVVPVFNRVGKETPEFIKQRLQRAAEKGLVPTPSTQHKERGGRDDYPGRS